jgi:hypothetical protein
LTDTWRDVRRFVSSPRAIGIGLIDVAKFGLRKSESLVVQHRGTLSGERFGAPHEWLASRMAKPLWKAFLKLQPGRVGTRVVTRVSVSVEIHESGKTVGTPAAKIRYFGAGHRVADQDGRWNAERIDHAENVVGQALIVVTGQRLTRCTEATTRDPIDMTELPQLWSKLVEDMGAVARSSEQHDGATCTTPIENFETNAVFNCDEPTRVFRWILPSRWWLGAHRHSEQEPEHSRQLRRLGHECLAADAPNAVLSILRMCAQDGL